MAITPDEVRHVAALARLKLTDDEVARFSRELSAILQTMDEIAALDTSGVVVPEGQGPIENAWRDDVVEPFGDRASILAQAPGFGQWVWRVPGVR